MNWPLLLAALLSGATVLMLLPPTPRLARLGPAPSSLPEDVPPQGWVRRGRWLWAGLALCAGVTLIPGPLAVPGGAAAAWFIWTVATTSDSAAERRRQEQMTQDLPHVVELFGAALAAGAAVESALGQVIAALPSPATDHLRSVVAALRVGVDPGTVWRDLAGHQALAPLGRSLARSHESGAPVGEAIRLLAEDLADSVRADVEDRARAVGVKAALPLGLCLLPAFLLLGIAPVVAGAVSAIRW